jgi:hypothetical protein
MSLLSSPSIKGRLGEFEVKKQLNKLDAEEYTVLHDVLLPTVKGKTSQLDHLVISKAGIFVIETKNYRGWIYGSERSKQWTQVIYKRKERFYNPLFQNYGHIQALKQIVGEQFPIPYYSLVVFSERAVLKKMEVSALNTHVLQTEQLLKCLKGYQEEMLNPMQRKGILYRLQARSIERKEARKGHIEQIKKDQAEKKSQIKAGICPKCGGSLVQRKGRNGSFYGCSQFPACRFTS